ncbi:MAG: MerR family transcriptional regulator [Bryobacterales bacterium]
MAEQLAQEVSEQTQPAAPEIPDRLFFRIGDVAELAGVETYVLRFWEGEFPTLAPKKTSNGQRQYRRKDVETVLEIKRLLYAEGYTIAGARKVLQDRVRTKKRHPTQKEQNALPFVQRPEDGDPPLHSIKRELQEILALLSEH